jgi:hypothetical protein
MFDPTVFDNLKVAFENQVYDLDNLTGNIRVTDRIDRLEMAVMAREFALRFELADGKGIAAEIRLEASLAELAAEILEQPDGAPGCVLKLRFYLDIGNVSEQCPQIDHVLQDIWQPELPPTQTLSFVYGQERSIYSNTVEMRFNRKINEDQMEDVPDLIAHMNRTLTALGKIEISLE